LNPQPQREDSRRAGNRSRFEWRDLAEEMPWDAFYESFAQTWDQGQHVTIIGRTGSGKTTLARELLSLRRTVVAIATKPKDEILGQFGSGFRVARELPLPDYRLHPRVIFWPPSETVEQIPAQRTAIRQVMSDVYRQGGDAIYIDETYQLSKEFRLEPMLNLLWRAGRSQRVTVVSAAQRPAHIPLVAYNQASHLFFFRTIDPVDIRRVAGFAGQDRWKMQRVVENLPEHTFVHINTTTGAFTISKVVIDT
jgi:energy-coupling factor transporter ATP-binding protein EcfA2